jgi:ElaB/YqjD/DUF883 family membrane-anchored ribosome-binding protein
MSPIRAGGTKTQAEGMVKQVKGSAQDMYGQARDAASDVAGTARDTATSFEKLLRNTIETQPYTAVFVALGMGWLLGRMPWARFRCHYVAGIWAPVREY